MPARNPRIKTAQEQRIAKLESHLAMARWAILHLMSDDAQRILTRLTDAKDRIELWSASERAAEAIVDLCPNPVQPLWRGEPLGAPRAPCPLCGGGTASPREEGYALPTGLMRHLLGSHNSSQCDVFEAAFELALDFIESDGWQSRAGR